MRTSKIDWYRTRQIIVIASVFLGILINCSTGYSQQKKVVRTSQSRERTQEYINDYTNSLGVGDDFGRPGRTDGQDLAPQGQVDVKVLRPLLRGFADSTAQLTYSLNDQMNQQPGLRQFYVEALRLSGTAANINKRAEAYGIDNAMLDQLQQLDADWRELAYRLENLRGLSNDSVNLFADINEIDKRMRTALGIQPQLDRRQLTLKAAALVADLDNLQDDISSELGRSENSQFYRRSISRVRQVAMNLVSILREERSDNGLIVAEFKQFESLWSPVVAKLRMEDDRYIERSIHRVANSSSQIHQLLLLPQTMDQSQFSYLAKSLKKDIDQFFERTPLILVMHLPNSKQALPVAEQFYHACTTFTEVVNRSQDPNSIIEAFRIIEQAQRAFNDVYRDVDSDRAVAVLNRINQTVDSLRTSLHIQRDDFDNESAADLAAAIQNCTDQIAFTCKRWFDQDRQPFATECLEEAIGLAELSGRLHDDIVDGKRLSDVREEMTDVVNRCRRVYAYLAKCQTDDRATLVRLSSTLTPALNELRTMIMP